MFNTTQVTIDPDTQEAAELRTWWEAEGSTATLTPLGQVIMEGGGEVVGGGVVGWWRLA